MSSKKTQTQATETPTATVKRGRPTVEGSARQARLARWESLKAQGYTVRAGRPKGSTKKGTDNASMEKLVAHVTSK
jgi:hypothetical protein